MAGQLAVRAAGPQPASGIGRAAAADVTSCAGDLGWGGGGREGDRVTALAAFQAPGAVITKESSVLAGGN